VSTALLELRQLHVSYGGIKAVRGIDLQVEKGELVCLIGANGAGKSTTLKAICGLVPASKDSIHYAGKCIVGAPAHISDDLADAREQVRWFPAMVSNHVMDLVERYGFDSEIPQALTDYVKARKFYDYDDHSRVGAKHGEFVTDEICDRFCVLGTPEQATAKLRELEAVGVDQFNIYLMTQGQEAVLKAYGDGIIPGFA
jgi:ABC-type dipeptide/oligopeptide/nickel transport system ATPase component